MGAEDRSRAPPAGYAQYATFQPTFLYEIIWNLSLAGFLVWLGRTRKIRAPGLFALYVAGYSAFRMFEETLRIDYSNHILGVRLNFLVAPLCASPGWSGSWRSSAAGGGSRRTAPARSAWRGSSAGPPAAAQRAR